MNRWIALLRILKEPDRRVRPSPERESLDQFGCSAILQFHSFSYPKRTCGLELKSELQLAPLSNVYDTR